MKKIKHVLVTLIVTCIFMSFADAQNLRFSNLISPAANSDVPCGEAVPFKLMLKNENSITFTTSDTLFVYYKIGTYPVQALTALKLQNDLVAGDSVEITINITFPSSLAGNTITLGLFAGWSKNNPPNNVYGVQANFNMVQGSAIAENLVDINKVYYSNGLLHINIDNKSFNDVNVMITDISGRTIRNIDNLGIGSIDKTIQIGTLNQGIYILSIYNGNGYESKKFIVR